MWRSFGQRSTRLALRFRGSPWKETAARQQVRACSVSANCAQQVSGLLHSSPETGARDLLKALPQSTREALVVAAIHSTFSDKELASLIGRLDEASSRAVGIAALSHHFGKDFGQVFEEIDKDRSGDISRSEFRFYLHSVLANVSISDSSPPTRYQLFLVFFQAALPNVIFGALDNSIMIVGGDVVEDAIGSVFHLSTLACAGLANTFADVFGMSVGKTVERFTSKLGMPQANLSPEQAELPIVRRLNLVAGPIGIFIGCIIGMTPLFFRDEEKRVIATAFARADSDNNGAMSINELVQALRAFHASRGEEADGSFEEIKQFETNADGKVDLAAFTKGYKRVRELCDKAKEKREA